MGVLTTVILAGVLQASAPVPIAASVLPPSRHATASGDPVTFFAAMVNQGASDAVNCRIEIAETGPFTYTYRAFDPATSSFIADPNTPVTITGGGTRVFVLGFEFSGTMDRTSFEPAYVCDNGEALPVHALTNITLTASATPQPDILALASTNGAPGVNGGYGNSVFAIAITNLNGQTGIDVPVTISADAMDRTMFARFRVCEIDNQARCISPVDDQLTTSLSGRESRSFAIWVGGTYSFSPSFLDFVRIRTRVSDPVTDELFGSTSVAHSNTLFGALCSGMLPAIPWSGSITHQTGDESTGQITTSRVEDLNFYGDGLGNVFAVPIDRGSERFVGSVQFEGEGDVPGCYTDIPATMQLYPLPSALGRATSSENWLGSIRWSAFSVTGSADISGEHQLLRNRFRAIYTGTHAYTYPISGGVQGPQVPPPGQIEGQYSAVLIRPDGSIDEMGSWTVSTTSADGPIAFVIEGESDATCQMTIEHRPIEVATHSSEPPLTYRNNRLVDAVVSDCSSSSDALEGQYRGVMIYQPMTVAGAPNENGLEVILTPSDPDQEQHMLWFLLRQ
jgi:hypothetical protein